jgi:hypothetical protein
MPQIIITTDGADDNDPREVHRERVNSADVATDTASNLLVERISWALSDAQALESEHVDAAAGFTRRQGSIADTGVH